MERTRSSHHDDQEAITVDDGTLYRVQVRQFDIDSCIQVSIWRGLLTVFSLLLVVTDVPRTGLVFSLKDYYPQVNLDTVMRWGPYEYHVAHVNTTPSFHGAANGAPLLEADVWVYKYDTLSIPLRAFAAHLNVSSYPPCVLYKAPCGSYKLPLATVFHMLDGLVTSIKTKVFPDSATPPHRSKPYIFATRNTWIDRLHHYLFRLVSKNLQTRLHRIHYYAPSAINATSGLTVCGPLQPEVTRPIICDHAAKWRCDHPIHPLGKRQIAIWDHMAIRYKDLQRRYADATLEMVLFITRFVDGTHLGDPQVVPNGQYTSENLEITSLIRGQKCDADNTNCRTVFVDDYRYERGLVRMNGTRWQAYTWVLRGASQAYMWLRVALLTWGCYTATASEPNVGMCTVVVQ